ncbi:MAG: hypothetical protein J3K34DRAFT_443753 [Monoraphidium minutum]|nr:MAG: hypothetical protein J3K34DRAFT_443753 [Monoraphidium minutum]
MFLHACSRCVTAAAVHDSRRCGLPPPHRWGARPPAAVGGALAPAAARADCPRAVPASRRLHHPSPPLRPKAAAAACGSLPAALRAQGPADAAPAPAPVGSCPPVAASARGDPCITSVCSLRPPHLACLPHAAPWRAGRAPARFVEEDSEAGSPWFHPSTRGPRPRPPGVLSPGAKERPQGAKAPRLYPLSSGCTSTTRCRAVAATTPHHPRAVPPSYRHLKRRARASGAAARAPNCKQ